MSQETLHGHEQVKTPEAHDRSLEIAKSLEANKERSPEQQAEHIENARHEAKEVFAREAGKENKQGGEPSGFHAVRKATKEAKDAVYKQTMRLIRAEMTGPSRAFSKIIHAPIIERSSEVIGGTLARPCSAWFSDLPTTTFALWLLDVASRLFLGLVFFSTMVECTS